MSAVTYAVTDKSAEAAFSYENYAAIESGEQHTLTLREVLAASEACADLTDAKEYLRGNGGGWYFDDELCTYWVPAR